MWIYMENVFKDIYSFFFCHNEFSPFPPEKLTLLEETRMKTGPSITLNCRRLYEYGVWTCDVLNIPEMFEKSVSTNLTALVGICR